MTVHMLQDFCLLFRYILFIFVYLNRKYLKSELEVLGRKMTKSLKKYSKSTFFQNRTWVTYSTFNALSTDIDQFLHHHATPQNRKKILRRAIIFKDCHDKNSRRVEQEVTQQIILAEFTQTTSNVPTLPASPVYPVAEQPPSYESITTIDR